MRTRIRVVVRVQSKQPLAEKTHTLVVSAHGGLVLLGMPISNDQVVVLQNVRTEKEILCRVAHLGSRFMGKTQVALEFIKPAPDFWGVEYPPDDWASFGPASYRAPAAKALDRA